MPECFYQVLLGVRVSDFAMGDDNAPHIPGENPLGAARQGGSVFISSFMLRDIANLR